MEPKDYVFQIIDEDAPSLASIVFMPRNWKDEEHVFTDDENAFFSSVLREVTGDADFLDMGENEFDFNIVESPMDEEEAIQWLAEVKAKLLAKGFVEDKTILDAMDEDADDDMDEPDDDDDDDDLDDEDEEGAPEK